MNKNLIRLTILFFTVAGLTACKVNYSLRNAIIPAEVKTVKIGFIENRARYINPQLSPKLTDKLLVKITNQTKL
ncbi:MAG: hypothetical protein ACRC0I_04435, partial [Sediminibacterium sp.]